MFVKLSIKSLAQTIFSTELQPCDDAKIDHHCKVVTSLQHFTERELVMLLLDNCVSICTGMLNKAHTPLLTFIFIIFQCQIYECQCLKSYNIHLYINIIGADAPEHFILYS